MAMLVEGAAKAAVDLQLVVQAWIVHRRTGDKPGKVPPEALAVPLALWKAQFQAWGERLALDNVPPWAVAMVLTSLVMPMQYAGREKKPAAGNLGEVRDAEYSEVHTNGANGAHAAA